VSARAMVAALLLAGLALAGCGGDARVVDPQTDLHLSGNWNDADAREVVAALGPACLGGAWIDDFVAARGRAPVVRVGHIHARTRAIDDEIDPAILTDDLVRALIASGRVRAVASRAEAAGAGGSRDTRAEFAQHAAIAPAGGQELGADYLLTGTILTQDDQVLDPGLTGTYRQVKFYQATLELVDLTTNEKVWIGSAERKKLIEQSTTGW
jgi:hypothetical protein